jgi:phosphoenolpyruvate synthase/pyruvate phosphate dikinase
MEQGIESLSLNPDTVVETWLALAAPPRERRSAAA